MKVLVIGSIVVDLCFYSEKIPKIGETLAGSFEQGLGGKGFNQAIAAARAGAKVSFLGAVGHDLFAEAFEKKLREEGIHYAIQQIPKAATGAASIQIDKQGQNSIIVSLGANALLQESFLRANQEMFSGVNVLLLQHETNIETNLLALQLTHMYSPQALKILNPAPAPDVALPKEIYELVDLLTPNETELAKMSRLSSANLKEQCDCLPIKDILVTLGEKGAYLSSDKKFFPAFSVLAVDTAGAGDAFNGALAAALAQSQPLEEAIRFASAAAAISVTRKGTSASTAKKAEILSFLTKH